MKDISPEIVGITTAVILVSELDAAVKGQGGEPEFAVEAAVKRIAELAR